jgi:sugar-specific transcriptional regulator TrmB
MTGMDRIPQGLISSLNTLGLTNYEARVFATLVLFDHAEAKEIVDYLSLSKPSVYEALENLAGRGLAVKQRSKPARFRAVSPEIAVSILMGEHEKASRKAFSGLKKLEKEKMRSEKEDVLWTIYGDSNIEYKIQELFGKAKHTISCVIGDRYIGFLDHVPVRDIPLRLVILSESTEFEERLRKKFTKQSTDIHRVSPATISSSSPVFEMPEIKEAWKYLKFENVLELNIDDEELLLSVAFFSEGASVLNTRNKGAIIQMSMLSRPFWDRFLDDAKGHSIIPPEND